ncbi:MAG: putative deacylase [Gammaproteobacteria bacterium]|jgi:predicted deacylase
MSHKRCVCSRIAARAFLTAILFVLATVELAAAPNSLVEHAPATRVPVGQSPTSSNTSVVAPVSDATVDQISAEFDGKNVESQSLGAVDPTAVPVEVVALESGGASDNVDVSSTHEIAVEIATQAIGEAGRSSEEASLEIDDTTAEPAPAVGGVVEKAIGEADKSSGEASLEIDDTTAEPAPAVGGVVEKAIGEADKSSGEASLKVDDSIAQPAPVVGGVVEKTIGEADRSSGQGPLKVDDTTAQPAPAVGDVNEVLPAIDADKSSAEALPKTGDTVVESVPAVGGVVEELPAIGSGQQSTTVDGQTEVPIAIAPVWAALDILGAQVEPGTRRELHWSAGQSFAGSAIDTPVVVVRGARPGPTLCLTAAVHGDELNGVEITRQIISNLVESELAGTIIGVPIVNLLGFSRGSRYLPDRRDLNRYFPGAPSGSSASRIAYVFFKNVIRNCDRLVDFHTGSFKRTNLPQLRANLKDVGVREFIGHFGATAVLHKEGGRGTLRRAATDEGIPAVAFELGEPGTLQLDYVEFGVKALNKLIAKLQMLEHLDGDPVHQPIFYRSRWLRAPIGGILSSTLRVGVRVKKGDVLGVVTNPLNNESSKILSQFDGRILGRALNQFVLPGFATFHVGIELEIVDESTIAAAVESAELNSGSEKNSEELSRTGDAPPGDVDEDMH